MSVIVGLAVRVLGLCGVSLSPFVVGSILFGVATLALGTGAAVLHHKIDQAGYARALSEIAEENADTIERATEMRKPWKECRARGGQWDSTDGSCS